MSSNVWVKSGKVINICGGETTTGAKTLKFKDAPLSSFQATVLGTGAVTATVEIEGSNDGAYWCDTPLGTITLSGTTSHTDGFTVNAPWKYVRANITAISGTGANVSVLMGV